MFELHDYSNSMSLRACMQASIRVRRELAYCDHISSKKQRMYICLKFSVSPLYTTGNNSNPNLNGQVNPNIIVSRGQTLHGSANGELYLLPISLLVSVNVWPRENTKKFCLVHKISPIK